MKKVLSVLLALVMMLSLSVVAFADATVSTVGDLRDALAAGGKVTLGGDIVIEDVIAGSLPCGLYVPVDVTVTLDLAGHSISQTYAQTGQYAMILNDGNLTITDSGNGGAITYTDSGNGGEYISDTIYNRSVIEVKGGTIENLSSATVASNGYPHALDNYSGIRDVSATISGGTIYCAEYSAIRMFCVSASNTCDLVINEGATIKGAVDMQNGTKVAALGSLTINGGNFETTKNKNNIRFANWNGGAQEYGITASIEGGTFDGKLTTQYVPAAANWDKEIVSGGTFTNEEFAEELVETYQQPESTIIVGNDAVTKADDGTVSSECAHNGDWEWGCNEDIHVKYCLICEEFFGDEEPHEFGEWTVTKEPTKIHKGERVHTCEICDYEEVETLSRVSGEDEGHLVIPESQKPAEDKDTGKANPATGSVEFVNVAIALGTVSLAAAAAVVLKK